MRISRTDTCARPVARTAQGCANRVAPPLPSAPATARPAFVQRLSLIHIYSKGTGNYACYEKAATDAYLDEALALSLIHI